MKFAVLGTCVAGDMLRMPMAKEYGWTLVKNVVSFSPLAIADSCEKNENLFSDMPADVKDTGTVRQNGIDDLNGNIIQSIINSNPDYVIVDLNEFRIAERVIELSDGTKFIFSAKGYTEAARHDIVKTVENYYDAKAVKITDRRIEDFTDAELIDYISKYKQVLENEIGKEKLIFIETNPIVNYMCNSSGGGTIKYVENFKTTGNICNATQRLYALCKGIINAIPFPQNNIGDDSCISPFIYHYCKPYYDYLTQSIKLITENKYTEELQQSMLNECELSIHGIYNSVFCKDLINKVRTRVNTDSIKVVLVAKTKQFCDMFKAEFGKEVYDYIPYNENSDLNEIENRVKAIKQAEPEACFVVPELFRHQSNNGIYRIMYNADLWGTAYLVLYTPPALALKDFVGCFFDIYNNYVNLSKIGGSFDLFIQGSGCYLEIDWWISGCATISLYANSSIKFAKKCRLSTPLSIYAAIGSSITVGAESSIGGVWRIHAFSSLQIGKNCLFSYECAILSGDGHSIFSIEPDGNCERVNKLGSDTIVIGDHIWVGYGCVFLTGSDIGSGSIVGAGALVNKKFPNNCIIAGVPAKQIKKNIAWSANVAINDLAKDKNVFENYLNFTESGN